MNAGGASGGCQCADPKNWWSTGRRFSWRRVVLTLIGVAMLLSYIYIGFSPSPHAERLRSFLNSVYERGQHVLGGRGSVHQNDPAHERRDGAAGLSERLSTSSMQMVDRPYTQTSPDPTIADAPE